MASVKKHLPTLKLIQFAKPKLQRSIIEHCDADLIKTILECIHNTLNGNIKLTANETGKLKKFKAVLRKLLKAPGNLNKKRDFTKRRNISTNSTETYSISRTIYCQK